jgi:hypothetical protein
VNYLDDHPPFGDHRPDTLEKIPAKRASRSDHFDRDFTGHFALRHVHVFASTLFAIPVRRRGIGHMKLLDKQNGLLHSST